MFHKDTLSKENPESRSTVLRGLPGLAPRVKPAENGPVDSERASAGHPRAHLSSLNQ